MFVSLQALVTLLGGKRVMPDGPNRTDMRTPARPESSPAESRCHPGFTGARNTRDSVIMW